MIAISGDGPERQAGMYDRWPTPSVQYVGDPDGQRYLRALDLFDPDERGGIGRPAMLVIAPDGTPAYRYVGRDFADRTTDDEVFAALEALELDAIYPPTGGPAVGVDPDLRGYFRPDDLVPYFKGNKFAAVALGRRTEDPVFRRLAAEHRGMADATLDAWDRLTST
ncbi:MAG: hypothetical protein ABIO83_06900 [Ilumatobacteraceae bacterium]